MRDQARDDRVSPLFVLDAWHSPLIEVTGYGLETHSVNCEFSENLAYFLNLAGRSRNEDHAIRTYTLHLAMCQDLLWSTVLGNQQTSESVSGNTALLKTKLSQTLQPAITFTPSSRLYSPAITLFRNVMIELGKLPSLTKVSAQ